MSVLLSLMISALPTQSFAVVVGENRPLDTNNAPLSFADDDAIATHRLLTEAGVRSTLLVRPDDATRRLFADESEAALPPKIEVLRASLRSTFANIEAARASGARTSFYFVYSGHGDVAHGEGFVALEDEHLTRTLLFEEILAQSPAHENHVVIDACRSYFMVFGKGPGGRRRVVTTTVDDARERFPNTGFILSTSSDRDSHEWARFGGGIFSHEVRSGLRGAADADLDANVTYKELGAFIETANAELANPRFRPDAVLVPPAEAGLAAVVLTWSRPVAITVPPDASLGHMVLEDQDGIRLADAHPAPDQMLRLHAGARPVFLRSFDGDREYEIRNPGPSTLTGSLSRTAESRRRGAAHLVFRKLFTRPFSATEVSQYQLQRTLEMDATLDPPSPVLDNTRSVAPWVMGGAALIGVGLTTAALVTRSNAGSSQLEALEANDTIQAYNTGAVSAYAVAGSAALWWLGVEIYHRVTR